MDNLQETLSDKLSFRKESGSSPSTEQAHPLSTFLKQRLEGFLRSFSSLGPHWQSWASGRCCCNSQQVETGNSYIQLGREAVLQQGHSHHTSQSTFNMRPFFFTITPAKKPYYSNRPRSKTQEVRFGNDCSWHTETSSYARTSIQQ